MEENRGRVKDLQYSFSTFLWRCLTELQVNWDNGNHIKALEEALSLIKYLPQIIQKDLQDDAERISQYMNRAIKIEGSDFQTTMLVKNRNADKVARYWFPIFVTKLMQKLDERGYLERSMTATPKYGRPQRSLGAEEE